MDQGEYSRGDERGRRRKSVRETRNRGKKRLAKGTPQQRSARLLVNASQKEAEFFPMRDRKVGQ